MLILGIWSERKVTTRPIDSVWDALEDDPVKRENLKLRSEIVIEITRKIDGMKQKEAAAALSITQPRVSALLQGRFNRLMALS